MKVLVTGGAGFIGSHVADLLIEKGHKVAIIDNLSSGFERNLHKKAIFYCEDLGNFNKIKEIFEKERPEIIYHLAAQINLRKSVEEPIFDAKVNILDSLNLLELARKFDSRFIFSSTGGAIYSDANMPASENSLEKPLSPYGCAKLAIDKYLDFYNYVYGLKFTSLRYSNVYGERQNAKGEAGVIAIFFDKMFLNEQPVIFGSGLQTRDFVYVKDVAKANLLALEDKRNEIYNVSTAKETSVLELFDKINGFFRNKFKAKFEKPKEGEVMKSCLSYEKIKKGLGWVPEIDLDSGLSRCYEWYKRR